MSQLDLYRRITELEAENERLREELDDSNGAYRDVMKEACAGGITYETDDRLHCTCVPHLREGVKALTARIRVLEAALDKYAKGYTDGGIMAREALAEVALTEPTPPHPREQSMAERGWQPGDPV